MKASLADKKENKSKRMAKANYYDFMYNTLMAQCNLPINDIVRYQYFQSRKNMTNATGLFKFLEEHKAMKTHMNKKDEAH